MVRCSLLSRAPWCNSISVTAEIDRFGVSFIMLAASVLPRRNQIRISVSKITIAAIAECAYLCLNVLWPVIFPNPKSLVFNQTLMRILFQRRDLCYRFTASRQNNCFAIFYSLQNSTGSSTQVYQTSFHVLKCAH